MPANLGSREMSKRWLGLESMEVRAYLVMPVTRVRRMAVLTAFFFSVAKQS
jgi:hypothetical protein